MNLALNSREGRGGTPRALGRGLSSVEAQARVASSRSYSIQKSDCCPLDPVLRAAPVMLFRDQINRAVPNTALEVTFRTTDTWARGAFPRSHVGD